FKAQHEWGWLAVLDFFLAGSGAGLFLVGMVLGLDSVGAIGVVAAALGALTLLADLGHPERFWRAISRPGTSWISRGAILVSLFLVFGAVHAAPAVSFLSWLPWTSGSALGTVTGIIAALAAIGVMAYTGFLLADSPAVPAWQSALVPVQFVVISLLTGAGGLYLLLPFTNAAKVNLQIWEAIGLGLGVCALLMLLAYPLILGSSTSGARRAGHELIGGHLGLPFLGGGVLVGLVIPIAVILYLMLAGAVLAAATAPLGLAGLFFIIGGLSFRYSLLKAGFYEPVLQASIMQGMGN
ncbi:MAG: DmsC/YnfH family molybdoenzyme membrane anchor subunit, partial [Dehalococcoidia bacterium]|nr:DmsC/YnfH family molybdoenzyme membrane anchor subunit [Dehalococcoidia bacterium]